MLTCSGCGALQDPAHLLCVTWRSTEPGVVLVQILRFCRDKYACYRAVVEKINACENVRPQSVAKL
jgi:hypothetical protein